MFFDTLPKSSPDKRTETLLLEDPIPERVSLTVATVNAWDGGSKASAFARYLATIASQSPDFIFVQEAPTMSHPAIVGVEDRYEVVSLKTPDYDTGYERMMTLRRRDSPWRPKKGLKAIPFFSSECNTERVSTLTPVAHPSGATARIANVHLCGGRFDEEFHCGQEESMNDAKMSMLKQLLGEATIILGDFNSDFLAHQTPNDEKRLSFLQGLGCSSETAQLWHSLPYQALVGRGFRRVPFTQPTSAFGTQPDGIWYSSSVELREQRVLDALSSGASDHNGLMARFDVR